MREDLPGRTLGLVIEDGIAILRIDVPGRAQNVFVPDLFTDLETALAQIEGDAAIRGVVITSGKPGSFIAGADLEELAGAFDRGISAREAAAWAERGSALFRRLERCGRPVAAAINGHALGGGLELALACHRRFVADDDRIRLGLPEVTVGLLPAAGGTQRLPRLIGIEAALPLLLSGRHLAPAEALSKGIVDEVLPATDVFGHARAWVRAHPDASQPWDRRGFAVPGGAGPLASHAQRTFMGGTAALKASSGGTDPAASAILSCVFEGTQVGFDVGSRIEAKYFGRLLAGPVARNVMRTLFVHRRRAEALASRPRDAAALEPRRIGVVGAGMMGRGIAQIAAAAGLEVVLLDRSTALAEDGKAALARQLDREVAAGRLTGARRDEWLARVVPGESFGALAGADLVVEAVFEDLELKRAVLREVEGAIGAEALRATNTSTLSIAAIAEGARRPDRVIGIHFFSPVHRMPLVEIIRGRETSEDTLAHALDLAVLLRKTPIVVNDGPGFFTSRVFCSYIDEGMAMLAEGVAPTLIERAARLGGMPVGPLAVADDVSLDLQRLVVEQARRLGLAPSFQRLHAQPVIAAMNESGRLGRKVGAGFYDHASEGRKRLSPALAAMFPVSASQPTLGDARDRLLHAQALEAVRCLETGVVIDPADADLGSVLGIGFPRWTGGVLSYVDTLGPARFVRECDALADAFGERFRPSDWLRERAARGQRLVPPVRARAESDRHAALDARVASS